MTPLLLVHYIWDRGVLLHSRTVFRPGHALPAYSQFYVCAWPSERDPSKSTALVANLPISVTTAPDLWLPHPLTLSIPQLNDSFSSLAMAGDSSSVVDGASPATHLEETPPSSPPSDSSFKDETAPNDNFEQEEGKALERNLEAERKRKASLKRKKKAVTHAEREAKAKELDKLLKQSAAFADILRGKTSALGRVGTALDGKTLGDHELEMATQPKCLVGGTMRDYQLEGVTWMYEVCLQGMSGILADEMGLGKVSCNLAPNQN